MKRETVRVSVLSTLCCAREPTATTAVLIVEAMCKRYVQTNTQLTLIRL
ncbi:MAG: hypothetical protein AAGB51_09675 [Planctomycetota bacterium]